MRKKMWAVLGTAAVVCLAVGLDATAGNPACRLILGLTFCPDGFGW